MSLANELLRNLSASQVDEQDDTLIIDHYSRTIIIPKHITNLGVENDDDVLRLHFRMPRYFGKVDLSQFSIRISYINAAGEDDEYDVVDATIVGDNLTFSWEVGPIALAYKGNTQFAVNVIKANSDGTRDKKYGTTPATLPVLEGLETSEGNYTEYADLIEQWRQQLFGIGDTEEAAIKAASQAEQENIANKGAEVLATIPPDYTTAIRMTDNAERTKADAIICSADGELITVNDSSDDHIRGLHVFGKTTQVKTTGKNLLNPNNTATFFNNTGNEKNGITLLIETAGTYTYYLREDKYTVYMGYTDSLESYSTNFAYSTKNKPVGGNIELKAGQYITIWLDAGVSLSQIDPTYFFVALGTDVPFEQYSAGYASPSPDWPQDLISVESPNATIAGKNLLSITTGGNVIGVTETVSDGLVSFSGTAEGSGGRTAWGRSPHVVLYPGVYTLTTYAPTGTVPQACLTKTGTSTVVAGGNSTFRIVETTSVYLGFNYTADVTYDAQNVSVQLEVGDVSTEYEPCRGIQTFSLTDHTLPGIPVTSGGNYTDSNGQQWVCDEIDFERGVYVKRINIVTFENAQGDITEYPGGSGLKRFNFNLPSNPTFLPAKSERDPAYCTAMNANSYPTIGSNALDVSISPYKAGGIYMRYDRFTTIAEFVEWATSVDLKYAYILKTPIETPLTQAEIDAFKALHTNCPNTTIMNDVGAHMGLTYNADTKTYLDNCFRPSTESWTFTLEDGSTVTKAVYVG